MALAGATIATGAWYYGTAKQQVREASTEASPVAKAGQSPSASVVYSGRPAEVRRALVVEQGQIYSGTIVGDGPLSKDTDDQGRKILEMMTPEQASQKLRKNEESWLIGRGQGVVRYDVVQIPSNDPIEDDHAEKIIEVPQTVAATDNSTSSSDWMFWGVYDGHSGWTTSAKLRQTLISYVARELNNTYKSALDNPALKFPTPESIDSAIKNGFLRLDNEIVHEAVKKVNHSKSKVAAAEFLAPALSGSCALLSFYDSRNKTLRVACTGDSRAVLGRRGPSGKWTATALSIDQTGANEEEAKRMRAEHPGEPNVVMNGRVLGGLEPTRAFGDAIYKWTLETQERLKENYFGRSPLKLLKTPPYVTAEPVITTTKVQPENGDFVVLATDGLWEMLTNEEVVGLVGRWLDVQAKDGGKNASGWLSSWFGSQAKLPVEAPTKAQNDLGGQRRPIRQDQWGMKADLNDRFVVEDKNAATHLVRNALGGKDQDQLCALLTLPSPYSRRYRYVNPSAALGDCSSHNHRDDLTVTVIFFGEGDATGNVDINKEASAVASGTKPKL